MDRYDFKFIMFMLNSLFKYLFNKDERNAYKEYQEKKKEWLMMEYYRLRTKRSAEWQKKHNKGKNEIKGIEQVLVLDRKTRYAWDMFKPMKGE